MKWRAAVCSILVIVSTGAFAQRTLIDSLKSLVDTAEGNTKLNLLNRLTYELINHDAIGADWYADQSIRYGEQIHNNKLTGIAYTQKGVNAYLSGDHRKGAQNLKKGLALAIKSRDKSNQGYTLLQLGNCYLNTGILDSSKLYFEQAYSILKDSTDPGNLSKLYRNLSVLNRFTGNASLERSYIEKSLNISRALKDHDRVLDALILKAVLLTRKGEYDSADAELTQAEQQALSVSTRSPWKYEINYNRILLLIPQAKYKEVFTRIDSARHYLSLQDDRKKKTEFLKNIGRAFSIHGDYDLAIDHLYEAQSIAERENYFNDLLEVQCELGWVTYQIGDSKLSLSFADKALENSIRNNSPIFMVQALNLKGLLLIQLNQLAEARIVLQADLDTCSKYHDFIGLAEAYINFGILEKAAKNQSKSIASLEAAVAISREKSYAHGELWAWLTLCEVFLQNGQSERALHAMKSADLIQKNLKEKEALIKTFELKKDIYKSQGNYQVSLSFAEMAEHLKDSIRSKEVINRIANLQMIDEIKQRESNIQSLMQQKELNEAQIKLKDSQIELQTIIGIFGAIGIVSLAFVALRFRTFYRRILVLNKGNQEKNEEIQAQAEKLVQSNRVIQELNHNLEHIVEEKTSDLKKTNEELIRSNNNLQQFSYVISHNLRGPIARLMGLTSILMTLPPGDELDKFVHLTHKSSGELDQIVTDLSKIINLKGSTNAMELVNLDTEFEIALQQNALPENFRDCVTSDFNEVSIVRSVKAFIQSIFYNLLSNAYKYRSPDRDLRITVTTQCLNGMLKLTVSDNGLGIDLNKHKDSIFKLFKRFHLNADGRGLGLYLVKEQVNALGGSIEIQSEPDVGTTFIILHPMG